MKSGLLRRLGAALALAAALALPPLAARAAQYDFGTIDPDTTSGTDLATLLGNWRDALDSCNKGSSAPSYAAAGICWIDDSAASWVLKIYDGSDWIAEGTIDPAANTFTSATPAATASVAGLMSAADKTKLDGIASGATANPTDPWAYLPESIKTADYTTQTSDKGKLLTGNKATTVTFTLVPAASAGAGFLQAFKNIGAGTLVLDGNASETIEGATTFSLAQNQAIILESTGSAWRAAALYSPMATQAQAEAGTDNASLMTPLRVKQAIAANVNGGTDYQDFTSSGTWTRPSGAGSASVTLVACWGAGGGGGYSDGGGGGGGAYAERWFQTSTLGSTESVSIGSGGTGGTSGTAATAGGNSSFGSWLTAYGGGAGASNGGGGGGSGGLGGAGGAGSSYSGSTSGGGGGGGAFFGAGGGSSGNSTNASTGNGHAGSNANIVEGGGGGGGAAIDGVNGHSAGAGGYGGFGGGGGGAGQPSNNSGGAGGGGSAFGGAGGHGGTSSTDATDGAFPGGGGGGGKNGGPGGAGGAGECRVTTFQ